MLCRKFEPIPIKIGFFMNFYSCSKIVPKSQYSTVILVKFHHKWLGENSPFLYFFLIYIHVLIFCRMFELILFKIGFFMNFYICSKIGNKSLYYYSTVILVKFHQKCLGENSTFLQFFLIHTHVLILCRKFEPILIKIGFL